LICSHENYRLVNAIPHDKRHCPERIADGWWRRNPQKQVLVHSDSKNIGVSFHHHVCCFA
jgi:hypothetical protein